ncbi:hypothetical protein PanWU01x14_325300, partial [Parasponia andersonii]
IYKSLHVAFLKQVCTFPLTCSPEEPVSLCHELWQGGAYGADPNLDDYTPVTWATIEVLGERLSRSDDVAPCMRLKPHALTWLQIASISYLLCRHSRKAF